MPLKLKPLKQIVFEEQNKRILCDICHKRIGDTITYSNERYCKFCLKRVSGGI